MSTIQTSLRHLILGVASAALFSSAALAANTALAEAQARYKQDMALCNSGQSNQDPATCRLEARNALAEARRAGLADTPAQYSQNASQRCLALKGSDRADCESRMRGEGNVQGSVAGGGILRETVTVVPAP